MSKEASDTILTAAGKLAASRPDLKIQVRGALEPGLSGASVFLVDCNIAGEKRLAIMKITVAKKATSEVAGDKRARECWINPYLPERLEMLSADEIHGLLITLAKDRLENCETLYSVINASFRYGKDYVLSTTVKIYSDEIERRWPDTTFRPLREHFLACADRALPIDWQEKWEEHGLPNKKSDTFTVQDLDYRLPNPIAFLTNEKIWPNDPLFGASVPWIVSHGDLNARNILCPSAQRHAALASHGMQSLNDYISIIDTPFCSSLPCTYDLLYLVTWLDDSANSFSSQSGRHLAFRGFEATAALIRTEQIPIDAPSQSTQFLELLQIVISAFYKTQARMTEDIRKAIFVSLSAACLWRAIRTAAASKADAQRTEASKLLCLSAMMLRELLPLELRRLTNRPTAHLMIECPSSPVLWTQSAAKIAEILARGQTRRNLILVLGRELSDITQLPRDATTKELVSPESQTQNISEAAANSLRAFGQLPLAAILDWSQVPAQRQAIALGVSAPFYVSPVLPASTQQEWREQSAIYYVHLRGSTENVSSLAFSGPDRNLARSKLRPLILKFVARRAAEQNVIYLGTTSDEIRETHTFLQEFWPRSLNSIYVGSGADAALRTFMDEWNIGHVEGRIGDFISACSDLAAQRISAPSMPTKPQIRVGDMERASDGTLIVKPGATIDVEIPNEDFDAIGRVGRVVTTFDLQKIATLTRDPKDFFIGYTVEFPELHTGVAIERDHGPIYLEYVRQHLDARHLKLAAIPSRPGAGSSTMLYWLAYKLAYNYNVPILFLKTGGSLGFEAIERLYRMVSRSIVVVIDPQDIPGDELTGLISRCAPARYPVVFLSSTRVLRSKSDHPVPLLDITLSARERESFIKSIARNCPAVSIARVSKTQTASMFLLTLDAFGSENVRIDRYVSSLIDDATPDQRLLLAIVACFSRYAHRAPSVEFLEIATGLSGATIDSALEGFDQLLVLGQEDSWSCRHDLLSKPILQIHLAKSNDDQYRYELARFVCGLLDTCAQEIAGREIAADYFWTLLNPQIEAELGPSGERPQQSRFIGGEDGLPTAVHRHQVFQKTVDVFPNHVNILGHFGKYLAEEENKFEEADRFLLRAFELEPENEAIPHMIGKRYSDEIKMLITASPPKHRPAATAENITYLATQAHEWFTRSRARNMSSEFGYTTAIQLNIRLIRDEFQRMGITSAVENEKALQSATIMKLLADSEVLVAEGQRFIVPREENRRVFTISRDKLHELRGDLNKAIICFQKHVDSTRDATRTSAKVYLARLFHTRGEHLLTHGDSKKANKDFSAGERLLFEALQDPTLRHKNIRLWFDCARHADHWRRDDFLDRLLQLHKYDESNVDAAFLLMCLYFCEALETRSMESWRRYEEFQKKSSRLSANLAVRRYVREWLVRVRVGSGSSSQSEFRIFPYHYFDTSGRETGRVRQTADARELAHGSVSQVNSSTEGFIDIPPMGFRIFFRPRAGDNPFYKSDATKFQEVSFLVGFNYEKPEAYDVQRTAAVLGRA